MSRKTNTYKTQVQRFLVEASMLARINVPRGVVWPWAMARNLLVAVDR
jgi:hypothetical protein